MFGYYYYFFSDQILNEEYIIYNAVDFYVSCI